MEKIAIYCVSYYSDQEFLNFKTSIEKSCRKRKCQIDIFVRKNEQENLGYFGGIERLMKEHSPEGYDYVIVSNVDILLDQDFFDKLLSAKIEPKVGWIAPQIASQAEYCDRNPKNLSRYSKWQLLVMRMLFRHPWAHTLYHYTFHQMKNMLRPYQREIYAGHGSFIILTAEYIKRCGIIHYPPFLYCEEIYVAEQCRENQLKVIHLPKIKIYDTEHVSTDKLSKKVRCLYNEQAINFILERYYHES